MKKIITSLVIASSILLTGIVSHADASTVKGMSANTTKVNHTTKEKVVSLAIKNDNRYFSGVEIQPQKLVNKKWVDLDWHDFEFVSPEQKRIETHSIASDFGKKKGTYRYHITVYKYDSYGFETPVGNFNTKSFLIK